MLENVSRADIAIVASLTPNRKIRLTQNCSKDPPDTVVNGIVQFSNLRVKESCFPEGSKTGGYTVFRTFNYF